MQTPYLKNLKSAEWLKYIQVLRSRDTRGSKLDMLLYLWNLKAINRKGWVVKGIKEVESVAAHSWGVGLLIFFLAPPEIDLNKAMAMALVHDILEVQIGDLLPSEIDPIQKKNLEQSVFQRWEEQWPWEKVQWIKKLWEEYAFGQSPEAQWVKACDRLDLALQARWYEDHEQIDLAEFYESAQRLFKL